MIRSTCILAPAALATALLLAGCGDDPAPAEGPTENVVEEFAPPAPEPLPVENTAPVENVAVAAPPPEVEPDQQMLDDADATGMTARVDRSDTGDTPPDETGQPAEAQ